MNLEKRLKFIEDSIECANGQALVAWTRNRPSFHTDYTSLDMVNLLVMYRLKGQYRVRRLPATSDRDSYGEQLVFIEYKDMARILEGKRRNMVVHTARVKSDETSENASVDKIMRMGPSAEEFSGTRDELMFLDMVEETLAREHYEAPLALPPVYLLTRDPSQLTSRSGGPLDMTDAVELGSGEHGSYAVPFSVACGKGIIVADIQKVDRVCMVMPLEAVKSDNTKVAINTGIDTDENVKGCPGPLRTEKPPGYQCSYRRAGTEQQ